MLQTNNVLTINFGNILSELENKQLKLCVLWSRDLSSCNNCIEDSSGQIYLPEAHYLDFCLDKAIGESQIIKFNPISDDINVMSHQKIVWDIEKIRNFIETIVREEYPDFSIPEAINNRKNSSVVYKAQKKKDNISKFKEEYRMKKMTANFYPAQEPKNGYIGKTDLTIGNAIRLNGISVFQSPENGNINISFPGFGDGTSYVIPKSKEAYAAMVDVIAMAVGSDNRFGYNQGEYGVTLDVSGKMVQEPYADGRFSVEVSDVCVLYGITTREVEYAKNGKDRSFVSVDLPTIGSYEKDGEIQYQTAFEGRISAWKDKEGNDQSINYGNRLQGLVLAERKALFKELKPSLDAQVKDADARKGSVENTGPNRDELPLGI